MSAPKNLESFPDTPAVADLDAVDFPALPATAQQDVASPSRRTWLGLSVAACGAALLLRPTPALALGNSDVQALRFLEQLEALQADFFTRAALSGAGDGLEGRERDVFNLIANQDREHKAWYHLARQKFGVAQFGTLYTPNASQSRPAQIFTFPATMFATRTSLFPAAQEIKDLAVAAYHGLVGQTSNGDITQAIAALAGIEGRHAAALREISGRTPLPEAFEPALSPQIAMRRLEKYGFRGEAML
jgi:hypothetical protein